MALALPSQCQPFCFVSLWDLSRLGRWYSRYFSNHWTDISADNDDDYTARAYYTPYCKSSTPFISFCFNETNISFISLFSPNYSTTRGSNIYSELGRHRSLCRKGLIERKLTCAIRLSKKVEKERTYFENSLIKKYCLHSLLYSNMRKLSIQQNYLKQ